MAPHPIMHRSPAADAARRNASGRRRSPSGASSASGPMPRKSGGRAYLDMEYGAGGGKGRLEKIKAYGNKLHRD